MENLTNEEILLIKEKVCPNCRVHGHLLSYGGNSQNIRCENCNTRFNVRSERGEQLNKDLDKNPFIMADIFDDAMTEAREYRLEAEIMVSMFNCLRIGPDELKNAIAFAFTEWDI